jgi:hypothetical protein
MSLTTSKECLSLALQLIDPGEKSLGLSLSFWRSLVDFSQISSMICHFFGRLPTYREQKGDQPQPQPRARPPGDRLLRISQIRRVRCATTDREQTEDRPQLCSCEYRV